jgi:hydroxyacyl-ACP dehydratase HTD2-like protein with hotdog domain
MKLELPDDGIVCDEIVNPSNLLLFRYAAVTWNAHRIHYDKDYALTEGYTDIIVPANLHIAIFIKFLERRFGKEGKILKISYKNLRAVLCNEKTNYIITVDSVDNSDLGQIIKVNLQERNKENEICLEGKADILIKQR